MDQVVEGDLARGAARGERGAACARQRDRAVDVELRVVDRQRAVEGAADRGGDGGRLLHVGARERDDDNRVRGQIVDEVEIDDQLDVLLDDGRRRDGRDGLVEQDARDDVRAVVRVDDVDCAVVERAHVPHGRLLLGGHDDGRDAQRDERAARQHAVVAGALDDKDRGEARRVDRRSAPSKGHGGDDGPLPVTTHRERERRAQGAVSTLSMLMRLMANAGTAARRVVCGTPGVVVDGRRRPCR